MINYLEDVPKAEKLSKDDEEEENLELAEACVPDNEFIDWLENEEYIYCLFCKVKETSLEVMCDHMQSVHNFNMRREIENMDFYKRIKSINYIRKQIYHRKCSYCDELFKDVYDLRTHMNNEKHYKIPDEKIFNQPEYYFPTFENDALLYLIDDNDTCDGKEEPI